MSLLEKVKGLFSRSPLPEETQLLLSGVADVGELRRGLDEIVTRNEVEARDIEREIEKLSRMEVGQKERVASGDLNKREKINVLREIKRLQRRMNSLEKRHRIHQDNIDLHLGLFDRITEMEAMELKQVTQSQIEEIAVDYEEKLDEHRDIMAAARAATGMESSTRTRPSRPSWWPSSGRSWPRPGSTTRKRSPSARKRRCRSRWWWSRRPPSRSPRRRRWPRPPRRAGRPWKSTWPDRAT